MYTPKTGQPCGCKRGIQRDNCPNCEGSGWAIDFRAIHAARNAEADTRRREDLQAPRTGYPGADQMMRWQRDYK